MGLNFGRCCAQYSMMSATMRIEWDRRIDVGVADHELLQDVVLKGAGEFVRRNALLFGRDDEGCEHRQGRAVHGHRHGHLVQRNPVEQDLHVLDGIDCHAGLAHIAGDAWVIAVIAPVGWQIEGHADALAAGSK